MSDDYPVHPAAAVFPMLDADELAALADDILTNGLITPLMLDIAGEMLVDGRNRREACRIAGVEPRYDRLTEGIDPVDYIVSTNIERRHLTLGQQAMARAMLYPDPAKAGRRKNGSKLEPLAHATKSRLSEARTILRGGEDLARQVMDGNLKFEVALNDARDRLQGATGQEAQMRRLREEAPDLAQLVIEERLTLAGATAELNERERLRQHTIDMSHRALAAIATSFAANVDAIIGGVELGEPLWLDPEQSDLIRKTIKLLQARGLLK